MGLQHFLRATELIRRHRYPDAERELRAALAEEPHDHSARSTLARVLCLQEKHIEALIEADMAIGLAPDDGDTYYTRAMVLLHLDRSKEALATISEAVRLQPEDPDNYSMKARSLLNLNRPAEALEAAEAGLAHEPEHTGCENARSEALSAMGRPDDAVESIRRRLARDPNDDVSHCNLGYALLRSGESEKAAEHFREALRLDPMYTAAREGLALSLKSRARLYSWSLRALLAFARLPAWVRWGGLVVVYGGAFVTRRLTQDPFVRFGVDLLVITIFVLWVLLCSGDALFTLILRADRRNRTCLSDAQLQINNLQIPLLLAVVLTLAFWPILGQTTAIMVAGVLVLTMVAVPGAYEMPHGTPRRLMALYVAFACLSGVAAALLSSRLLVLAAMRWESISLLWLFLYGMRYGPRVVLVAMLMLVFDDNVAAWIRKRHLQRRYSELAPMN